MQLRKNAAAGGNPTYSLELWESGGATPLATLARLASNVSVTSATGVVVSARWDASLLTLASGANVELRIIGTKVGSGGSGRTIEVGAVEWNAQVTAPPTTNELYFLRARYYDPSTGRFASKDPIEFNQRYAYAGGNPMLYADRNGMCGEDCGPFGNRDGDYRLTEQPLARSEDLAFCSRDPVCASGASQPPLECAMRGLCAPKPQPTVRARDHSGTTTQLARREVVRRGGGGGLLIVSGTALIAGSLYGAAVILPEEIPLAVTPGGWLLLDHTVVGLGLVAGVGAGTVSCGVAVLAYGDCRPGTPRAMIPVQTRLSRVS